MRVCRQISTQKILEMQSEATAGTLLQNAINAGFSQNDIEELVVDSETYTNMMALPQNQPPAPSQADLEAVFIAAMTSAPVSQPVFDLRRAYLAKAISDEAYRLGVNPGTLTPTQLSNLRARIAAIYKAL